MRTSRAVRTQRVAEDLMDKTDLMLLDGYFEILRKVNKDEKGKPLPKEQQRLPNREDLVVFRTVSLAWLTVFCGLKALEADLYITCITKPELVSDDKGRHHSGAHDLRNKAIAFIRNEDPNGAKDPFIERNRALLHPTK